MVVDIRIMNVMMTSFILIPVHNRPGGKMGKVFKKL